MILDRPVMLKEIAGRGVSAFLPQGRVYCGNKKLLEENGIFVSVNDEELTGSVVFVGVDGRFAGHFVISDTVKKDAKSAMIHLKDMGLGTVMLTGVEEISAQAVADGICLLVRDEVGAIHHGRTFNEGAEQCDAATDEDGRSIHRRMDSY